jgi:hypothetical protein
MQVDETVIFPPLVQRRFSGGMGHKLPPALQNGS